MISNIPDHIEPITRDEMKEYFTSRDWAQEATAAIPNGCACFRIHSKASAASQQHEELARAQGSIAAFHGSKLSCWYSILKHGLRNVSNTSLMTTGAVYGAGVYLSPQHSVSIGYTGRSDYGGYGGYGASGSAGPPKVVTIPDGADLFEEQEEELSEEEHQQQQRARRGVEFSKKLGIKKTHRVCYVMGICDLVVDKQVRTSEMRTYQFSNGAAAATTAAAKVAPTAEALKKASILIAPAAELVTITHLIVSLL